MPEPRRLPIVPAGMTQLPSLNRPCFECRAPCCQGPAVVLSPYDLYRLVKALGVPWQLLAEVCDGGTVALGGRRVDFRLRQQHAGCVLALPLPSGHGRCGAHVARPGRCRIYPFHVEVYRRSADYDVAVGDGALCPPESAREWAALASSAGALDVIGDEIAEQALARRLLARWELAAQAASVPVDARHFVAFCERIYVILDGVRQGPRADWQLDAYQIVDAFPLTVPSLVGA